MYMQHNFKNLVPINLINFESILFKALVFILLKIINKQKVIKFSKNNFLISTHVKVSRIGWNISVKHYSRDSNIIAASVCGWQILVIINRKME